MGSISGIGSQNVGFGSALRTTETGLPITGYVSNRFYEPNGISRTRTGFGNIAATIFPFSIEFDVEIDAIAVLTEAFGMGSASLNMAIYEIGDQVNQLGRRRMIHFVGSRREWTGVRVFEIPKFELQKGVYLFGFQSSNHVWNAEGTGVAGTALGTPHFKDDPANRINFGFNTPLHLLQEGAVADRTSFNQPIINWRAA